MKAVLPQLSRRAVLTSAAGVAVAWLAPTPLSAQSDRPVEVVAELPQARLLGSGRLSFFGLQIYDARLWVDDRFDAAAFAAAPLALELEYRRTLYGKQIAQRSLDEMKRVGGFSESQGQSWLASMLALFPDVRQGDRLTGLLRPDEAARFFLNGKPLGDVRDGEFARRFIGIWLSPQTSEPKLRSALLGSKTNPP